MPRIFDLSVRSAALVGAALVTLGSALSVAAYANPLNPTASDPGVIYTGLGTANTTVNLDTKNTIINWDSFNISSGETTKFVFGGNNWFVLNRLNNQGSASINGNLLGCLNTSCTAIGGNIWIYASDGVLIGPNARVNSGGFFATTAPLLSDSDFLSGGGATPDAFSFGAAVPGSSVQVKAGASINASSGSVALIAPQVSTEAGSTITASGNVVYGAAESYRIKFAQNGSDDMDLVDFEVPAGKAGGTGSKKPISIGGKTTAANVFIASVSKTDVADAVIDVSGTVTATHASQQGGNIVLSGDGDVSVGGSLSGSNVSVTSTDGTTSVSGSIAAQQASGAGGSIVVTGPKVSLAGSASLNTNGTSGGTILIGGDVHGGAQPGQDFSSTPVQNAGTTTVDSGAQISANGTAGAGGKVVVWSNDATDFNGSITATGNGGDGGFVETSGAALKLGLLASVNTLSTAGKTGEWLLDPASWTIANSGGDITPTQIVTDLESSDLTLSATSFISVTDTIDATSDVNATHSLFLQAPSIDLHCACSIVLNGGALDLNGAVTVTNDFTLGASTVTFDSTVNGAHGLTVNGNAVFDGAVGGTTALTSLTTSGGSLDLAANVTTTNNQSYTVTGNGNTLDVASLVTLTSNSGGITLKTQSPAANITIEGALSAASGTVTLTSNGTIGESAGSITASTLTGSSVGGATLTGTNSIGALGNFTNTSSGAFALTDAHALNVSGTLNNQVAANTTLTTTGAGSNLTISGAINANTSFVLTTISSGTVNESSGSMTAGALQGSSVGGATFTGTNHFGSLYGFTNTGAGGISLTNAQGLAIVYNPVNSGPGDLTLKTTSGGITIESSLIAGTAGGSQTVTLDSAGAISEATIAFVPGSPGPETVGTITGGVLTGSSVGGATLNNANQIGSLNDFTNTTSGDFALTDAHALALTGTISNLVGNMTLTASNGITITGTANTSGTQEYNGPVTLGATTDLTGSTVTFDSTVAGSYGLTISGGAVFEGEVGGGSADLTSIDVTGTTTFGAGADKIGTTGDQTYEDAVTLNTDTGLGTGGLVHFESTVDGAIALTVIGNAQFDGVVGGTTPLTSLHVTGTTAINANTINSDAITTTGTQTYDDSVTVGGTAAAVTLTGSLVTFGSTVDDATAGTHDLGIGGAAEFDGIVGGTAALKSLGVGGHATIDTTAITTSGGQTYKAGVTLGANADLTGSLVKFKSTLNDAAANTHDLTITGGAEFDGVVGGTALHSLHVTGATSIGTSAITTSTTQQYDGAVTLASDTNLSGTTITFGAAVDGGQALTVTGDAVFDNEVGGGTPLSSLHVTGSTTIDTDLIATSDTQTYDGGVILSAATTNLSGSTVTFGTSLNGANDLTVTGNAEFDGEVGQTTNLSSIDVTGTTNFGAGADKITTTGNQTYESAATLGANADLAGSLVKFKSTLDDTTANAHDLKITGAAEFDGAVGGTALKSVDVTGATTIKTTAITTSGDQTYESGVTLGANADLTGLLVKFESTLNDTAANLHDLIVTGAAEFDGIVGGTALSSLHVTGNTAIDTSAITTSGDQTYDGAANLTAATTNLTGAKVTFGTSVNAGVGGNNALTVTGNAEFNGEVGQTNNLTSIDVTGTTVFGTGGDMITTTGDQTYEGGVTLGANANFSGALVEFKSTLDDAAANTHDLTITGNAKFDGVVGGTALHSLHVTGATTIATTAITTSTTQQYDGKVTLGTDTTLTGSTMTFGAAVDPPATYSLTIAGNAVFDGAVSGLSMLTVNGTADINGGSITTSGTQEYKDDVTLSADANLSGTTITFDKKVDAQAAGAERLTVTGDAVFGGTVGTTALTSLLVTGSTTINTAAISTTGTQTYEGTVLLGADTTLTAGGLVNFQSTVDGAQALKVAGDAEFDGEVGAGTTLTSLDVTGTTDIETDAIKTTGDQTYEGAVTLGASADLVGSLVKFESVLNDTVANIHDLVIDGAAEFDGIVGGTALKSLLVNGATTINTTAVTTSGTQEYNGAVTLSSDTNLSGTMITFDSTVDGGQALTVTGNAVFDGQVGAVTKLTSLDVTGTTDINTDAIKAQGNQTYEDAVTLAADTTLTAAGVVKFGSTLNGAHALTVNGNAEFDGAVGGTAALSSLTTSGPSLVLAANVTTANDQSYTVTGNGNTLDVPSGVTLHSNSGGITLETDSPATNITIEGSLSAVNGTVTLTSAGLIDESTGAIAANTLTGSSVGGATLTGSNSIAQLGAFDNTSSGNIALTDAATLSVVGAVGDQAGDVGDVTLTTTGAGHGMTLAANITSGTATGTGTVTLDSAGTISQTAGKITGGTFTGYSTGGATLTQVNDVSNLAGFTNTGAGGFSFTDDPALDVTADVNSGAGDLTLTTTGASINGIILDASLIAGTDAGTQTVTLTSAGTIQQNAPSVITAGNFTGSSVGGATLNQTNDVANITGFTNTGAGGFSFKDDGPLDVKGAINSGTGNLTLVTTSGGITLDNNLTAGTDAGTQTVTLTSAGAIAQNAGSVITAGNLTGSSVGGTSLTQTNDFAKITGFTNSTSGGISITDDGPLDVTGAIDAGPGNLTLTTTVGGITLDADLDAGSSGGSQTIALNSAGAITQSNGVITTGTLMGYATGGVSLDDVNEIGSLGNFTNTGAGGFSFTNGQALNVAGTIDSGAGDLTLTTTTGAITLNGNIVAGTAGGTQKITLDAAGIISQSSVTITGGVLSGFAIGGISLNGDNSVSALGNFSNTGSGNITLTVGRSLAVTGTITNVGGDILLTTTGAGNGMTVTGTVQSPHTVAFNSAGDFIQNNGTIGSGAVDITAAGNILIGETAFTTEVATRAVTDIDQANTPFFTTSAGFLNHNFIVAQTLSLAAPQRIVIQNTGTLPNTVMYTPEGFALSGNSAIAVLIGGAPQVVDIFGSLIHNGTLIPAETLASTAEVAFAPGTNANNQYRLNGCTIHQNSTCTIINFDFKDFEPAKLSELILSAAQNSDDVEDDLTITGEGNDEIWAGQ
jgi:filamentous hemagglutinin family protein